ncbi:hypothetical protein [Synechococcus sp. LTW-R]|uniref:hypothetical protein n=1 Tax=Synechococcus sp. LTW-R TaxID=2751170 RepID=UPI0016277D22|nr:hypothetical protein [Synechococcus sp. LTW-R]QNG30616.1 hypothetical protein H0O22_05900 [Synechococcus sp. LTW-R]
MPGAQEQTQQRRWVGEQLGLYAKAWSNDPSGSKKLEALVADLAPNDPDLRSALKVVASRDGFHKLLNLSGSGKGQIEKQAFLSDLSTVFAPQALEAIDAVLCGVLNLPIETPKEEKPSPSASGQPEAMEAEEHTKPRPRTGSLRKPSKGSLIGAGIGASVVLLGALFTATAPDALCRVGLCGNGQRSEKTEDSALNRAKQAEADLGKAKDIDSYSDAAKRLELALNDLARQRGSKTQSLEEKRLEQKIEEVRKFLEREIATRKGIDEIRDLLLRFETNPEAVDLLRNAAIQTSELVRQGTFYKDQVEALRQEIIALRKEMLRRGSSDQQTERQLNEMDPVFRLF